MNRIRFIFEKRGFACFVRHVELPQLFGRIARRAGMLFSQPLYYTEVHFQGLQP